MQTILKLIHNRYLQAGIDALGTPADSSKPDAPAFVPVTSAAGSSPVVLDSPHSGTTYPQDFQAALALPILRQAEDTHVEKLYALARELDVSWVEAHFPRIYLDANRDVTEIDVSMLDAAWHGPVTTDPVVLQKVKLGKGLIWRYTDEGLPIYDRQLPPAEVQGRIDRYWKPYHAAVAQAIDAAHARHGYSIHINCHSMPAVAASHATLHPGLRHADFVVGDRDGTTASPALSAVICEHLRQCGYSVDYNYPYKGVELVRRYSNPARQRHSIQVEINRQLYMDEQTLAIKQAGFEKLQNDLRALVALLLAQDPRQLPAGGASAA